MGAFVAKGRDVDPGTEAIANKGGGLGNRISAAMK
jgi:hypothetical protein